MIDTSIIIANYNGEEFLPTCLDSLVRERLLNTEVIIADDCSTDKSVAIINKYKKKYKHIVFIKNKRNLGAAQTRNIAINLARGGIIIFLDNDTKVTRGSINSLIKSLQKDNKVGAVQALLVDYEDKSQVQNGGGRLIPQVGWLAPYYQKENVASSKIKDQYIIAISACLAVKAEVINKIGNFDDNLAVYTEDLDFSWRIWVAGWKIKLDSKAIVYHWTKSVSKREKMNANYEQIYYHLAKNSFTSLTKNFELKSVIKYLPVSLVINTMRAFYILLTKRHIYALKGTMKAMLWFISNLPKIIKLRNQVQATRVYSDKILFRYIFSHDSLVTNYRKYFI